MIPNLATLDGRQFDVVVIGGGAVGASAAQHLAAAGHTVLVVDKGDFGSGTSSRSSRLLYCGSAHLSPDYPVWKFVLHPRDLMRRLRMASLAMLCRAELVQTMPERLQPYTFFFPVYRNGKYPGWKVDLAFRALEALGLFKVSLNYRRMPIAQAQREFGMVRCLAQHPDLESVAVYTEYQYHWAERICMDTMLDAERLGAVLRNYARVTQLTQADDGSWRLVLQDSLAPADTATVRARVLVNAAGPWVDRVNALAANSTRKHLVGIKGINLVVKLPPECEGQGLETISSIDQPYYCMPWGKYHFFGPTETVYEGDPDDVRVLPQEIDFVLGEANRLFPNLNLRPSDVVYAWSGVRPRTSSSVDEGVKDLTLHDLAAEGMPNAVAVTGVPLMNHRHAGRIVAGWVTRRLPAGKPAQELSYAAKPFPASVEPLVRVPHSQTRVADLRHAAVHEHVRTLADLLLRRTDVGWTPSMGLGSEQALAQAVADLQGWDAARVEREAGQYRAFVREHFNVGRS